MKKLILNVALCLVAAAPAYAETATKDSDLALCKLRSQHLASAYQPGVDVKGNAVVAADVNVAPATALDVVRIPMTVDLAQRLGSVPAGAEMKAATGMIEIYKDGRVTFNGQDMSEVAIVLCDGAKPVQNTVPASVTDNAAAVPANPPVVAPAAPVAPAVATAAPVSTPAAPARPVDKILVPVDAPPLPVATVPVAPSVAPPAVQAGMQANVQADVQADVQPAVEPVVSRIRTDMDVKQIPQGAMTTKALPPHTLGQFIVPAQKAPETLQPAEKAGDTVVRPPVVQDQGVIFGQGN